MKKIKGYKNKSVLVTGGAGFIGSCLVRKLIDIDADVTVLDNFSSGTMGNLPKNKIKILKADVRDKHAIQKAVENKEIIFHLAAKPFIPFCYKTPREVVEVNMLGTLNLLEAVKAKKPESIVYLSTSEVYGTAKYTPMDENHPTNPHSTYSASKLFADRLCFAFHKEHDLPIVILRLFNSYGPRETYPYIIPETISQFSHSNTGYFGNLETSRDFTYVEDSVQAILLAGMKKAAIGQVINIGSGNEIKMYDLVRLIAKLMNKDDIKIKTDKSKFRRFDVDTLIADNKKAWKILGWKPTLSIKEGLEKTISWYFDNGTKWPWKEYPEYTS